MSDLFGNHIVGFPTRQLICLEIWKIQELSSEENFARKTGCPVY